MSMRRVGRTGTPAMSERPDSTTTTTVGVSDEAVQCILASIGLAEDQTEDDRASAATVLADALAVELRRIADEWEQDLSAFKELYGPRAAMGRGSCVADLRFRANRLDGAA